MSIFLVMICNKILRKLMDNVGIDFMRVTAHTLNICEQGLTFIEKHCVYFVKNYNGNPATHDLHTLYNLAALVEVVHHKTSHLLLHDLLSLLWSFLCFWCLSSPPSLLCRPLSLNKWATLSLISSALSQEDSAPLYISQTVKYLTKFIFLLLLLLYEEWK